MHPIGTILPTRAVSGEIDARRGPVRRHAHAARRTGGPALRVRPIRFADRLSLAYGPPSSRNFCATSRPWRRKGSGEIVVTVTTPSGEKWPVDSEELRREIEERSGRTLFLLRNGRGSYDAAPISLISRQTIARIAEESGTEENPWRFRPNLLIDLQDGGAFEELNWVGGIMRVGDAARSCHPQSRSALHDYHVRPGGR